jgi:hypothetical protein
MENKIPLPTDSIYKFYALFGLLLFIFSLGATIYVSHSTNDLVFSSAIEYEILKAIEKPTATEIAKRQGIEKRVEIALADKKFFLYALGVLSGFGMLAMIYGFTKWHRDIQPIQDETAKLQLEKLKLEVAGLTQHSTGPAQKAAPVR